MMKHPKLMLMVGLALVFTSGIGILYSLLLMRLTTGAQLQVMLGCCIIALVAAIFLSVKSAATVIARL